MGKRRAYTAQFKAQVALESLRGDKSQAALCREHHLGADLVSRWRQQLLERAPEPFALSAGRSAEQERITELERLVGQLTFELAAAKKSLRSWAPPQPEAGGDQGVGRRVPSPIAV